MEKNIGTSEFFKDDQNCTMFYTTTFIYKILNGHTAPNLKEAFRFNNERDIAYNLRRRETDLAQPLPKVEFGKRRFSYNACLALEKSSL